MFQNTQPGWVHLLIFEEGSSSCRDHVVLQRVSDRGGLEFGSEEGGGMRFVDLSRPLENTVPADPPGLGPRIEYSDHKQSLSGMLAMFPGLETRHGIMLPHSFV